MNEGVRGSQLVFWGRALGPSSAPWGGVFREPSVTSGVSPLQGEAGPPGLPGPPVSVLAVVGEGWPLPVWRGGWA